MGPSPEYPATSLNPARAINSALTVQGLEGGAKGYRWGMTRRAGSTYATLGKPRLKAT